VKVKKKIFNIFLVIKSAFVQSFVSINKSVFVALCSLIIGVVPALNQVTSSHHKV
jgi:hypothetical protein